MLIGVILDLRTSGSTQYRSADFKVAVAVHYLFWAIGLIGVLSSRRRIRRRPAARLSAASSSR